jgi:4,5-dihydroxyphthalate decarboxylase
MLYEGDIDALYTARAPSSFRRGDGRVVRLFRDYVEVEKAYFRETGLFPIMHCVVVRRDVYEENRWVAQSLFKAFCQAQAKTYRDLNETAALKGMLPWLNASVEEAIALMGPDFWPYGFDANRDNIATFLRYHHEQGLSKRRLEPEELFAPETLEAFKI